MWLHLITLLIVFSSSIANTASLPESEKKTICQQRPRCQIERVYPAGKATNGVSLQVIKVVLNLSKEEQKETEEDFTKGCRASDSDKKNGGEEYWLLERQQTPRKILTLCNDGYGASGVGEDIITVGNNRFTHTQAGGSASRWESTVTLSLSPLRRLSTEGCNFHTLNPADGEVSWETYDPLRTFALVKDRTFPKLEEKIGMGCPEKSKIWQWKTNPTPGVLAALPIPRPNNTEGEHGLAISPGTALGSCGVDMSLNGAPGFLVFGKADPIRIGYVRALVPSDNTLIVQIHDTYADSGTAENWIHTNHLEIWTASDLDLGESVRPPANKVTQIGVTLDGKVYRGVGIAPFPNVETWSATDEQNRTVRVLKLHWQQEYALTYGFLLAYAQAEVGKQVRTVANAGITRNRPDYLPYNKSISDGCRVENRRVELIREVDLPLVQQ